MEAAEMDARQRKSVRWLIVILVLAVLGVYFGWYKFFREEPQPFVRHARDDLTAVVRRALARDESACFEPVEQARHVRHGRHHPLADLSTRKPFGPRAAQDAKRVVLRARQVGALEDLGRARPKILGRPREGETFRSSPSSSGKPASAPAIAPLPRRRT